MLSYSWIVASPIFLASDFSSEMNLILLFLITHDPQAGKGHYGIGGLATTACLIQPTYALEVKTMIKPEQYFTRCLGNAS